MSENLIDDLEEGEIADDIVVEPIIEKVKTLPRRYVLNDGKVVSKHKKNCKHAVQHHKRKSGSFNKNWKLHKKHHKACPKHNVSKHSKLPVNKTKPFDEDSVNKNLHDIESEFNYPKRTMTKCAFKNYMSPPRKVSQIGNFNSIAQSSENSTKYSKLLSDYKKSRDELNKFKNISNLKVESKKPRILNDKFDVLPKQMSGENISLIELPKHSDDEDEAELRRLALATCSKRSETSEEATEMDYVCQTNSLTSDLCVVESDNYDLVDMEMGNSDSENLENGNDLYVIDTTPAYFCELNQPSIINSFDSNFVNSFNNDLQNQGFLSNLNFDGPTQNFSSDTFCQELNNDLYSNFETVEDSTIPASQLDDEFEEELLRAELIANMKSVRQKNESEPVNKGNLPIISPMCVQSEVFQNENILKENRIISMKTLINRNDSNFNDRIISIESGHSNNETAFNDRIISIESGHSNNETAFKDRIVSIESGHSNNETNFNDRIISIESVNSNNETAFDDRIISIESGNSSNETAFKEERTVSIVNDKVKKENVYDRTRSVTAVYSKNEFLNASSMRKGVDIKVKLNNVQSSIANVSVPKITLPQERLIISLNNESSSDDSDLEETIKEHPIKNPAVASLEALITNARHESDGKKDGTINSNSSDALSWLSKAQQEEYNSLKKILDAKKQYPFSKPSQIKATNTTENSELILLKKKLLIAKKNLEKEKEIMQSSMKELVKKKRAYMLSKLKSQHLKEQLLAAERVRKSNLQLWTKCSSNLQTLKKSVSKREALINSLQTKLDSFFPEIHTDALSPLSSPAVDHSYNACHL